MKNACVTADKDFMRHLAFVFTCPAKKNSKNRPKGTLTKSVEIVNND